MNLLQKPKGFTLIEVLITLIIFSISVLAFAGLASITTRNNSLGGNITEAATFAHDKLEQLRATHWEKIAEGTSTDNVRGTAINYRRTWSVVTTEKMKTVVVTVLWNNKGDHQIRLVSVLAR